MFYGILYCEFDDVAGPVIAHEHPAGVVSQDQFDSISDYIIAPPQLCGKFTAISLPSLRLLGFPICIANDKYKRNALFFNVCFILGEGADLAVYQPALRKIATALRSLEIDHAFLFNPKSKRLVGELIRTCHTHLLASGRVAVRITPSRALYAELHRPVVAVPPVQPHDVPVPVRDLARLSSDNWDLALRRVLPHIDGVSFVRRIAERADVGLAVAQRCVHHLAAARCVRLVDVFQYSAVYATTPAVVALAHNPSLQADCAAFATHAHHAPPPCHLMLALLTGVGTGTSARDIALRIRLMRLPLDERRLITFSLLHGILRRVHAFPIRLPPHPRHALHPGAPGADPAAEPGTAPEVELAAAEAAITAVHRGGDVSAARRARREVRGVATAAAAAAASFAPKAAPSAEVQSAKEGSRTGMPHGVLKPAVHLGTSEAAGATQRSDPPPPAPGANSGPGGALPRRRRVLDGSFHFDALCCEQGRPYSELVQLVRGDPRCAVIAK